MKFVLKKLQYILQWFFEIHVLQYIAIQPTDSPILQLIKQPLQNKCKRILYYIFLEMTYQVLLNNDKYQWDNVILWYQPGSPPSFQCTGSSNIGIFKLYTVKSYTCSFIWKELNNTSYCLNDWLTYFIESGD